MRTVDERFEKLRDEHVALLAASKGKPLRFFVSNTEDGVGAIEPDMSLESTQGFMFGREVGDQHMKLEAFSSEMSTAFELLMRFKESFSLFTARDMRVFVTRNDIFWDAKAKLRWGRDSIRTYELGTRLDDQEVLRQVEKFLGDLRSFSRKNTQ